MLAGFLRTREPPNVPKKFEKVPMPASVNDRLKRRSLRIGMFVFAKEYAWYSNAMPQHCAL